MGFWEIQVMATAELERDGPPRNNERQPLPARQPPKPPKLEVPEPRSETPAAPPESLSWRAHW